MAKILKKMTKWLFQIDHNWPVNWPWTIESYQINNKQNTVQSDPHHRGDAPHTARPVPGGAGRWRRALRLPGRPRRHRHLLHRARGGARWRRRRRRWRWPGLLLGVVFACMIRWDRLLFVGFLCMYVYCWDSIFRESRFYRKLILPRSETESQKTREFSRFRDRDLGIALIHILIY